jgi:hypothetical protein
MSGFSDGHLILEKSHPEPRGDAINRCMFLIGLD